MSGLVSRTEVIVLVKDSSMCSCSPPEFLPVENQMEPGVQCEYCRDIDEKLTQLCPSGNYKVINELGSVQTEADYASDDLPF
jgi:hypothetical protein